MTRTPRWERSVPRRPVRMPAEALGGAPPLPAADLGTLRRIYAESGAASTPSATDWSEYAGRVVEWVASLMFSGDDAAVNVARLERVTLYLALAALLALMFLGASTLWRALRPSLTLVGLDGAKPMPLSKAAPARPEVEARARLDRGDLEGALEASWWWFARLALRRDPATGMTTRDVLRASQRTDLRAVGRDLDRLRFSPVSPDRVEVRTLLDHLGALR